MRKEWAGIIVNLLAVSVVSMSSGCGQSLPDHVTIATAEGLRAHHDGQNAMISEQRGQAYFTARNFHESERTERGKCNMLAAMFGKCPSAGNPQLEVDK